MEQSKAFKIFMNHTSNAGVVYYRMVNFAKYMSKQPGVSLAYSKFDYKSQTGQEWEMAIEWEAYAKKLGLDREKLLNDMDMLMEICDIAIWQTTHFPGSNSLFNIYRDKYDKKKLIVTELDDYLFGVNPENVGFDSFYPNSNPEYFAEMQIRNSNYLIVSTPWLKDGDGIFEGMKKYNPNIECIPNSIDFSIWDTLKNKKKFKRVRIGWAGGQAHYRDLEILKKVIPAITQKYKNVDFMFFGGMPDYIKTTKQCLFFDHWHDMISYPGALASLGFDIGIAPLRDNMFNRAKSNLRWLEYSALKIPTVASPRVPFDLCSNIVRAEEVDEWIDELSKLIENRQEREELGLKAYKEVKKDYNAEKTALKYLDLLKELAGGKRPITVTRYDEQGSPFVSL
jgi:glycosyltransferase involved in cell wall biosynthesis